MSDKQEKKREKFPKHMSGKTCGYELFEDGSIRIAPAYSRQIDEAMNEQLALDEFLGSISRVAQKMSGEIAMKRKKFWDDIAEDYGIDPALNWEYNRITGRIRSKGSQGKEKTRE